MSKPGPQSMVSLAPSLPSLMKSSPEPPENHARYLEERLRHAPLWEAAWEEEPRFRDLVFPSLAGAPISHSNLNKQHFEPLLGKA